MRLCNILRTARERREVFEVLGFTTLFCNIFIVPFEVRFTTISHILQKIKHRDKERKKKIMGLSKM